MTSGGHIVYLWLSKGANDATRTQINFMPIKSRVIIIFITTQGQIFQKERFMEGSFIIWPRVVMIIALLYLLELVSTVYS